VKVLVADKLSPTALAGLEAAGFDVESDPALAGEALAARVAASGAEVLVVRSTRVDAATLEAGQLALVVRAGAGVNTIDVDAASRRGVCVANCPGKNAIAVAELTLGLILALDRRIPDAVNDLRAGRWDKKGYGDARGLAGRTVGLIGLGAIGREVAARCRAFDMEVVAWSRSLDEAGAEALGVRRVESPRAVAAACDVLSVHVALTGATRGLVGAEVLGALRDGALVVNTSRGDVVDGAALRAEVEAGRLRAGLDVWNQQPADAQGEFTDPLGALPGVYGTHHNGASTAQAQEAIAAEAVRVAGVFKRTGTPPNCVNLAAASPAACSLTVRHLDRVGVLAFVLERLREAEINVKEMQNVLFTGDDAAACATIRVSARPGGALLETLRGHPHVLAIQVNG